MTKSYFRTHVDPTIQTVVNLVSLHLAAITFCLILILGYFRRQVLNRVTVRFQGLIALIDIAKHFTLLNSFQPSGSLCVFFAFSLFFLNHIYIYVNCLIALNVQLIYLHNVLPKPVFEIFYLLGASILAFVVDLIPFAYDAYGKNNLGSCFLNDQLENRYLFKVFLLYASLIPGLIYCTIIFIVIACLIRRQSKHLENKFPSKQVTIFGESVNGRDFIRKLYFRISLYPISSVLCFFPNIVDNFYFDLHNEFPDWMYFIFRFSFRLIGTLNFISLLYDPHFQIAVRSVIKHGFSDPNLGSGISLKDLGALKKDDEEYLVEFPGEESIKFEDYVKFL